MAAVATQEDELNPLTGNDDAKNQENMVEINLDNPRDPPKPSTQQQAQTQQEEEEAIAVSDIPRQQEKDWAAEVGMACNKGYNWFPLGLFAWISGWLLIACGIGDLIIRSTNFIEFWLYVYLLIGALLILVIDCPIFISLKVSFMTKLQLIIFDWVKLFRRIWGRSILYIIMMITCASFLANDDDPSDFRSVPWIAGIYLLVIIVLSYIFSYIAAKKYNAIREYIIQSTVIGRNAEDVAMDEGDNNIKQEDEIKTDIDDEIAMKKFISKFEALDVNKTGKLQISDISKLGEECGNTFSNSEKYAVMLLLDKECNGFVTKPEWILQFKKHKKLKML